MKHKLKVARHDLKWSKHFIQTFYVEGTTLGRHNSAEKMTEFNIRKAAEIFLDGKDEEQRLANKIYYDIQRAERKTK